MKRQKILIDSFRSVRWRMACVFSKLSNKNTHQFISQPLKMIANIFYTIFLTLVIFKIFQKFMNGVCNCNQNMIDKVVIVTGANSGIGFETAKDLASRGAKVIIACRNKEKGATARDKIINETTNENVILKHLDLSSFKSVRDFCQDIIATENRVDVLINNAGMGKLDNSLTEDDLPIETQVNYFGPFLLTMSLLELIKSSSPSRIINVSSVMHKAGKINLDTFHRQATGWFEHMRVYSNTKLANILFTLKLSKELRGTGVTVNCLHPGAVYTEIFRERNRIVKLVIKLLFKTAAEGAQTSIHLAVSPELQYVTGKYFVDCKEAKVSKSDADSDLAEKLWSLSKKIVSETKNKEF